MCVRRMLAELLWKAARALCMSRYGCVVLSVSVSSCSDITASQVSSLCITDRLLTHAITAMRIRIAQLVKSIPCVQMRVHRHRPESHLCAMRRVCGRRLLHAPLQLRNQLAAAAAAGQRSVRWPLMASNGTLSGAVSNFNIAHVLTGTLRHGSRGGCGVAVRRLSSGNHRGSG